MAPLFDATSMLVVVAGLIALPITLLALARYRQAVGSMMDRAAGGQQPAPPAHPSRRDARSLDGTSPLGAIDAGVARNAVVAMAAGGVVGVAYAALFAAWNDLAVSTAGGAVLAVAFAWPAVLGVWIVAEGKPAWVWSAPIGYVALLGLATAWAGGGLTDAVRLWVGLNLLPTVVVGVVMTRPFRAVGTLVLGVVLTAVAGALALGGSGPGPWPVWRIGLAVAGFAAALALGWAVAAWLARWYSAGGFSDQMLLLGSVCYVFCIDYAVRVAAAEPGVLVWGTSIFAVVAAGTIGVLRVVHPPAPGLRLLILRVFSTRTDRMLERLASRWRYLGPVRLIAAPDLAVATIDPHEFLAFAAGDIARLFVRSTTGADARIAGTPPDADGRHRIEELFCFDDTWRPVVAVLLARSDVVVMDARGFSSANRGVADELTLLDREGAMPRTVMVVGPDTDRSALGDVLDGLAGRPAATLEAGVDPVEAVLTGLGAIRSSTAGQ